MVALVAEKIKSKTFKEIAGVEYKEADRYFQHMASIISINRVSGEIM